MDFETLISVEDLKAHLHDPDWRIMDCRYVLEDEVLGWQGYVAGHIPGALYAHLEEDLSGRIIPGKTGRHPLPEVDDLVETLSNWGIHPQMQVVAYDDTHGGFAARLWWLLRWLGHERVAVLDGGWKAWNAAGFHIEFTIPKYERKTYVPNVRNALFIDADRVEQIRKDPAYMVVDSRTRERYDGIHEPIDPVPGHIPGAKNIPFQGNLRPDGKWKSQADLRQRFGKIAADIEPANTVFYCGSGVTACHNILSYQIAGFGEALLYPGSWSEWINGGERFVATNI